MSCYHVAKDEPRAIRGRHGESCPPAGWHPPLAWDCRGCRPCERPHCAVFWTKDDHEKPLCEIHAESVCPSCLGRVREHLGEVVRLSGLPLLEEVLTKGASSEAADLLGPTADPAQWRQRGTHGHRYEPGMTHFIGELHPLWVLGTWDLLITEHLGHTRTSRITINSAADYLDRNLHFLAADVEFDFPVLAGELRSCRAHLESVLHDGERADRGAACLTCGKALERQVSDAGKVWYRCRKCRDDLTDAEYLMAQKDERLWTAELLSADDMAVRTDVPASTIRRWGNVRRIDTVEHPPLFRSVGRNGQGRKVYRVTDVERVRDSGGDMRGSSARAAIMSNDGVDKCAPSDPAA